MCGMKSRVSILMLTLFCLLSLSFYVPSMCTAETVQVDKQVIVQLQTRLTTAQQDSENLLDNWKKSDQALARANEHSEILEARVAELELQLTKRDQQIETATNLSKTSESNWQNANQLLTAYRKETQAEIAALKQKNKLYELAIVAMLFLNR